MFYNEKYTIGTLRMFDMTNLSVPPFEYPSINTVYNVNRVKNCKVSQYFGHYLFNLRYIKKHIFWVIQLTV